MKIKLFVCLIILLVGSCENLFASYPVCPKPNSMEKEKMFIYQVLPRIFGNTNSTREKNGDLKSNGVGKFNDFSNKALSEIHAMGFNYIWYTGAIANATYTSYPKKYGIPSDNPEVVKGKAGSPYAIKNYYDVNPDYAVDVKNRMGEFENLIARSQANDLKVIMDFVPNHVAREYKSIKHPKGIKDLGQDDDKSVLFSNSNNFYYMPGQSLDLSDITAPKYSYKEEPAKATGNNVFSNRPSKNDWYETIKLNYGVDYSSGNPVNNFDPIPSTWVKMKDILLFWASKGIDGFRCDMAEMVPVEFWGWAIPQVKATYPQLLFIAEIYNPNEYYNYVHNGKFDYLYDKVDMYDTLVDILKDTRATSDITFAWQHVNNVSEHLLYFLENHDEVRVASDYLAKDPFKVIPAFQLISWMNTNPVMLYFGQEMGESGMGESGFSGNDGRTTIFDYWSMDKMIRWNNNGSYDTAKLTTDEVRLREMYLDAIKIAKNEKCITDGCFYDLMYANYNNDSFDSAKTFVFIRSIEDEFVLIVNNFADHDVELEVEVPQEAFEFMKIYPKEIKSSVNITIGKKIEPLKNGERVKVNVAKWNSTILKFKK